MLSMARRLPVGVVAVITPFNFPLGLGIRSVAPALALGNAVILKPDLRTAVSGGVLFARVFEEAGLPEGLLHVLPGGADAGEALVAAREVRVISFTGSTEVGRKVGELAARHFTRAHLELGGNNALVVLEDADLDRAVNAAAFGSFRHQGQICMTVGRHMVAEEIADAYVEAAGCESRSAAGRQPSHRRRRARPGHRRASATASTAWSRRASAAARGLPRVVSTTGSSIVRRC